MFIEEVSKWDVLNSTWANRKRKSDNEDKWLLSSGNGRFNRIIQMWLGKQEQKKQQAQDNSAEQAPNPKKEKKK